MSLSLAKITFVFLMVLAGLIAGFIDAIAGGGGLVTLPALTLAVGPGAQAIGSNKIVGTMGALIALLVYLRGGHMDWGKSLVFAGWVALGSVCGSLVSPLLPPAAFKALLILTCPLILYIVFKKDLWVTQELKTHGVTLVGWQKVTEPAIVASGLACGFYDGCWGPGGGTFMFLALLFVAKLPLLTAIAASKFANTSSASFALASYGLRGYVHWLEGSLVALGMSIGAYFGARYASKNAVRAVRPLLAVVVALLLLKMAISR